MPAPPDESEPAMVSAIGIVIVLPAGISAIGSWSCFVLARGFITSKFACHRPSNLAVLRRMRRSAYSRFCE